MIGGPTDQWLDSVEQHRANAKIRRERGSSTIRILTTAEADRRAKRDAEARSAWENLLHHTKAGWDFARTEAIEQLRFELYGSEWEEFTP